MWKRTSRYSSLALIALWIAFSALAADTPLPPVQAIPDQPAGSAGTGAPIAQVDPERLAAPTGMPFDLPSDFVTGNTEITLTARSGDRILVSEAIALPKNVARQPTVVFLANHEKELRRVRNLAKVAPDAVHFTVALGEQIVVDLPFVDADRGSAALAEEGTPVVGTSRSVQMKMRDPRRVGPNGMEPDPQCLENCNFLYDECLLYCDPMGQGCQNCWTYYNDCVNTCPKVCVEPKDVYEHATSWQFTHYTYEQICIGNWYRYYMRTKWEQRTVYTRTVHCDNTYTDVYLRTETRGGSFCKIFDGYGCIGNINPPPNC